MTLPPKTLMFFKGLTQDVMDKILDYTERYVLTRLYHGLFCPATTADEEKDLAIQTRIRTLHWVTAQQLDLVINDHDPQIRHELDMAITGVWVCMLVIMLSKQLGGLCVCGLEMVLTKQLKSHLTAN